MKNGFKYIFILFAIYFGIALNANSKNHGTVTFTGEIVNPQCNIGDISENKKIKIECFKQKEKEYFAETFDLNSEILNIDSKNYDYKISSNNINEKVIHVNINYL